MISSFPLNDRRMDHKKGNNVVQKPNARMIVEIAFITLFTYIPPPQYSQSTLPRKSCNADTPRMMTKRRTDMAEAVPIVWNTNAYW